MVSKFLALPDHMIHATVRDEWILTALNSGIAFLGMYIAYLKFGKKAHEPNERIFFYRLLMNKLYIDTLYDRIIVRPIKALSLFCIDKVENFIMGSIYLSVKGYHYLAIKIHTIQNGDARIYLVYIMSGVILLSLYVLSIFKDIS